MSNDLEQKALAQVFRRDPGWVQGLYHLDRVFNQAGRGARDHGQVGGVAGEVGVIIESRDHNLAAREQVVGKVQEPELLAKGLLECLFRNH